MRKLGADMQTNVRHLIARGLRGASQGVGRLASAARIAWLRACYPGLRIGSGVVIGAGARIRVLNGATMEIGSRTVIEPYCHLVSYDRLTIGVDCHVGAGSIIVAVEAITIGDDALIAAHVVIRDQDHRTDLSRPYRLQGLVARPVSIGANVWIGAQVIVLKGVTIGDGAILAAGALVNRSVEAATVVAGIPARALKTL